MYMWKVVWKRADTQLIILTLSQQLAFTLVISIDGQKNAKTVSSTGGEFMVYQLRVMHVFKIAAKAWTMGEGV